MQRILSAVLISLITTTAATAARLGQRDGWVVIETRFTYPALEERLEAAVKAEHMGLVTSASASQGAKAAGVEIPGNKVVGVFRNDYARRMLAASLAAGIEAPVRFYVTENPDGTATLSYKKPSVVFAPYADEGKDALKILAAELDGIFAKIAQTATQAK